MKPASSRIDRKKHNEPIELQYPLPILPDEETIPENLRMQVRQRTKTLNCLYQLALLAEHYSDSIDDFLQNLVIVLPLAWRCPEITCARVLLNGKTYETPGCKITKWVQSSQIFINHEPAGKVEVFFPKRRPSSDEGPSRKEEQVLLDVVAEHIGKIGRRVATEQRLREASKQLADEHEDLQKTKEALRTVLTMLEDEKSNLYKNIQSNVENAVMPILNTLSLKLPKAQQQDVDQLKRYLVEITSPFLNYLSRSFPVLTPKEIKICDMIRSGLRTKEIAQIEGLSMATINCHREHIRHKLGIANKNINLVTFLQSNRFE